MMKIEGIDNVNPELFDKLAKKAVSPWIRFLFNASLRALNLRSIGYFMYSTRDFSLNPYSNIPEDIVDPVKEADKVYANLEDPRRFLKFFPTFIRLFYALPIFFLFFSFVTYKWYRFFSTEPYRGDRLAESIYLKLKKSRNLFPLSRYFFKKSEKIKSDQQLLKEAAEKLDLNINIPDAATPEFHFILTSDQKLFNRFSDKLIELGAITNIDQFKAVFYGYRGTQVSWNFESLSLLFMIEFMRYKNLIYSEDRSKSIEICFFDGKNNKQFNHLTLNNAASTNKLTSLDDDKVEEFIRKHKNSNSHRIYRILKEVYGF